MKKIISTIIVALVIFGCSSNSEDTEVQSDKIIGNWGMISQKVNGIENVDNCRSQTTFTFETSRVLRQVFFRTENNVCNQGDEIISSWFNLGNSTYRINGSNGSRTVIEILFSEADTKFTTRETDVNNTETITVFEKF